MLMRDMGKAVTRIQRAIASGETIAVFGDYDVDGITSTVLLMDYLKSCGVNCLRYIPRRIEDGYGLSKDAIQGLHDQGATLMITVDCGITGNEEVEFANSLGMDVVVTDHHECKENLPDAVAVVDPHRPDCPYPFKHLAGWSWPWAARTGRTPCSPDTAPWPPSAPSPMSCGWRGRTGPSSPVVWRPCPTRILWAFMPF